MHLRDFYSLAFTTSSTEVPLSISCKDSSIFTTISLAMDIPTLPDHEETQNDSPGPVDRHTKGRSSGYFSLPAEIRNVIMRHVLVPGQIHIRPPPISTRIMQNLVKQSSALPQPIDTMRTMIADEVPGVSEPTNHGPFYSLSQYKPAILEPGCQFLATCRRAYTEGREWFYTLNTFYIPPGPLSHAVAYFNQLQPSNLALIRTICIRFTLEDVTSAHIKVIDHWMLTMGFDSRTMASSLWRRHVMKAVGEVWNAKLRWVRNYTHLEHVILESPLGALDLKGAEMQVTLKGALNGYVGHPVDGYEECSADVAAFMRATSDELKWSLESQSFTHWNTARKWLLTAPYRTF